MSNQNIIPITSITVTPSGVILAEGESIELKATVYPNNATNKSIRWTSSDKSVATVNMYTGVVIAQKPGSAYIYAEDWNEGVVHGYCLVGVQARVPVESLTITPQCTTIGIGEERIISGDIYPTWATDTSVSWSTSNRNIVDLEMRLWEGNPNGNYAAIIGKSEGTAVVTATSKDNPSLKSTCTVTVTKERVVVEKDGNFFTVRFQDGTIWKSIGCDMSLPENNSGNPMDLPDYPIFEHEERCKYNYNYRYTKEQFALLYILDPWGVEYYLSNYKVERFAEHFPDNYTNFDHKYRALLNFKDDIYKEIFGISPRPFTLSDNGDRIDIIGDYDRLDVYTDAELLFGSHNIYNPFELLNNCLDLILKFFDLVIPAIEIDEMLAEGINVAKLALFSAGVLKSFPDLVKDFIKELITDIVDGETADFMEWVVEMLEIIYSIKEGLEEISSLSDVNKIKIYNNINSNSNYRVEFKNGTTSMFIDEIVDLCS